MNKSLITTGLAAALAFASNNPAHADDASLQRLESELNALRTKVQSQDVEINRLRSNANENWLNERRAEEVKSLVRDVLADAETRASLLAEGVNAGYNRGFFIRSNDGSAELRLSLINQIRYIHNHRDAGAAVGVKEDTDQGGFQLRRTQVDFQGHFISPNWTYRLRLDSSDGGTIAAAWAWVGYKINDDWSVRVGQLKPSFLHEENVGGPNQLAAERSYTADYFTTDFSQGIQLTWQAAERLKLVGTFHTGSYSARTGFTGDGSDLAFAARAEYLVVGEDTKKGWRQFSDFNSWSGDQAAVLLGAAVNYEQGESGGVAPAGVGRLPDILKWTADVNAKVSGLSLFAAIVGQHFDVDAPLATGVPTNLNSASQLGVVAQVAYFVIPDKFEPFVRYEWIDFDNVYYRNNAGAIQSPGATGSRNLTGADQLSILTVGGNYYIKKHDAKLTLDLSYAFDPVPVANTGTGLLQSVDGDQLALRAQLQFKF